jgi:hypothetical protein
MDISHGENVSLVKGLAVNFRNLKKENVAEKVCVKRCVILARYV